MSEPTPTVSTKPYLIRAIYDWCTDAGFTPYVAVAVDDFLIFRVGLNDPVVKFAFRL